MFNNLIETMTKFSRDDHKSNPVTIESREQIHSSIRKFLNDIKDLRTYFIRRQIMEKLEE